MPIAPESLDWSRYAAALFDLDGVITPTAVVHMHAWARMFGDFLADRPGVAPYTDADYYAYVDGKPRYDGVRSFLASRGITLPEGAPDDPVTAPTVCGLGNRKDALFGQVLEQDGVAAYPGSLALLRRLKEQGIPMAVVSSSRNAPAVLTTAGLFDCFDTVVSGAVAAELGLAGKPAPDTFLHAAEVLGTPPDRAVVFEDAVSGVAAGRAGGFGLVVGVDRGAGVEALTEHGADLVVADLQELVR
jgi:beta-phosphoglucomutase family hydrolase